jgi:hypothetical protein
VRGVAVSWLAHAADYLPGRVAWERVCLRRSEDGPRGRGGGGGGGGRPGANARPSVSIDKRRHGGYV